MSSTNDLDVDRLLATIDVDALTAAEAREVARGLREVADLPVPTKPDRIAAKALRAAADALDALAAHR